MLTTLKRWLAPPLFQDEEETHLARVLNTLLLTLVVCVTLALLITALTPYRPSIYALLAGDIILVMLLVLMRSGHLKVVSFLLLLTILTVLTYILWVGHGIHDVATIFYATIPVMGSLLLPRRAFITMLGLTIGSVTLMVYAEMIGWIDSPYAELTSWDDIIFVSLVLVITAVAVRLLANDMVRTMHRARQNEKALAAANDELQARAGELRRERDLIARLMETSPAGIVMVATDGQITFANPGAERILGLSRNEIIQRGYNAPQWRITDEGGQPFPEERLPFVQVKTTHRPVYNIRHAIEREGGCRVYLAINAAPLFNPKGELDGIVVALEDITEQRQAEAGREALIQELQAKNAELERFTYSVSHDLKSPLITIRGFLGFLEKDALAGNSERLKVDIQRIKEATDKMAWLLEDLLELSRIGRLINPPQVMPFEDIVHEAIGLVHGQISERGIKVSISPELPQVYGDRVRLVEVVQNLVDNAAKFMGDQAEPSIKIGSRETGEEPVFYVQDNGQGIPPQYQHKVFGLFEKLDPAGQGTGIGLALVKRIIEVHGGHIWIESEGQGQGTTVCFTLPAGPEKPL